MYVAEEFGTGWGICDLVGCRFDPDRIAHRTERSQRQPLGSAEAIRVYAALPDAANTDRGVSAETLRSRMGPYFDVEKVDKILHRLVSTNHAIRKPTGTYQKVNGWAPLHTRLVAVELKLSRWADALNQACTHRAFALESFVGLPKDAAERAARGSFALQLRLSGVGLLGVTSSSCEILIEPRTIKKHRDDSLTLWATECFWRRYRGKH